MPPSAPPATQPPVLPRYDPTVQQVAGEPADEASGERGYRITQIVGGALFGTFYGICMVGALLYPNQDRDEDDVDAVSYLLIPVAGPFATAATLEGAEALFISVGILQTGSLAALVIGSVGVALADEPTDVGQLQVLPLISPTIQGAALTAAF